MILQLYKMTTLPPKPPKRPTSLSLSLSPPPVPTFAPPTTTDEDEESNGDLLAPLPPTSDVRSERVLSVRIRSNRRSSNSSIPHKRESFLLVASKSIKYQIDFSFLITNRCLNLLQAHAD